MASANGIKAWIVERSHSCELWTARIGCPNGARITLQTLWNRAVVQVVEVIGQRCIGLIGEHTRHTATAPSGSSASLAGIMAPVTMMLGSGASSSSDHESAVWSCDVRSALRSTVNPLGRGPGGAWRPAHVGMSRTSTMPLARRANTWSAVTSVAPDWAAVAAIQASLPRRPARRADA